MTDYKKTVGSKAEVWHGTAKHTSGKLSKKNLMKNKHGRIVSKRKHALGKSKGIKILRKAGYTAKKGVFKAFKKSDAKKSQKNKSKKNKK